ncbi:hypothetical protein [Celeribacter sp.]|uniref:hypothetical protein n=1 Tax=Celeribacter sp. TaxID=1890673 RepID=UPI003A8E70E6
MIGIALGEHLGIIKRLSNADLFALKGQAIAAAVLENRVLSEGGGGYHCANKLRFPDETFDLASDPIVISGMWVHFGSPFGSQFASLENKKSFKYNIVKMFLVD